jgi:UTP-glucose-1-phosphate uridylyltransferase
MINPINSQNRTMQNQNMREKPNSPNKPSKRQALTRWVFILVFVAFWSAFDAFRVW